MEQDYQQWFLSKDNQSVRTYKQLMNQSIEMISNYYETIEKPYHHWELEDRFEHFNDEMTFKENGRAFAELKKSIEQLVLRHSLHISHTGAMAHLHCPPAIPALVAEVFITALNQSMDSWDQSPIATYIEDAVIKECVKQIGYEETASGVFTSGGTQSNYMGMLLARNDYCKRKLKANVQEEGLPPEANKLRIFCSEKAHFTVQQSAAQLGLGMNAVIPVKTNERYEMCMDDLCAKIELSKESGELPMAIVATIGTTDFGSIDSLHDIHQLAATYDMWVHADAAYGGGLLFSKANRHLVQELKLADSITIDFHKWFYQPISCGAFFVKAETAFQHIQLYADYLNPEEDEHLHLVNRSIQTTKRFDALKVWLTFQMMGTSAFGKLIDQTIQNARQLAGYLQENSMVKVMNEPMMNAVVFKYQCKRLAKSAENQKYIENKINTMIQQQLYEKGTYIIAKTKVNQEACLKVTMLNPMIELENLKQLIKEVIQLGNELEQKEEALRECATIS